MELHILTSLSIVLSKSIYWDLNIYLNIAVRPVVIINTFCLCEKYYILHFQRLFKACTHHKTLLHPNRQEKKMQLLSEEFKPGKQQQIHLQAKLLSTEN